MGTQVGLKGNVHVLNRKPSNVPMSTEELARDQEERDEDSSTLRRFRENLQMNYLTEEGIVGDGMEFLLLTHLLELRVVLGAISLECEGNWPFASLASQFL